MICTLELKNALGFVFLYGNDFVDFQDCRAEKICNTVNKVETWGWNDCRCGSSAELNVSRTPRGKWSRDIFDVHMFKWWVCYVTNGNTIHCKMFRATQLTASLCCILCTILIGFCFPFDPFLHFSKKSYLIHLYLTGNVRMLWLI